MFVWIILNLLENANIVLVYFERKSTIFNTTVCRTGHEKVYNIEVAHDHSKGKKYYYKYRRDDDKNKLFQ